MLYQYQAKILYVCIKYIINDLTLDVISCNTGKYICI